MTNLINTFITSGLANYFMTHEPVQYERNNKLPEKFRSYKVPDEFQEAFGAELIRITKFDTEMRNYRSQIKA